MNYSDMSDFEINIGVALMLGQQIPISLRQNSHPAVCTIDGVFDYCNNPADAWPIITENRIAISPYCDKGWFADRDSSVIVDDVNPLRAAMIVFLMMNEGNNGL